MILSKKQITKVLIRLRGCAGWSAPVLVANHRRLSKKRITKVLIRLRGCAGWSAPVLVANHRRQVFSRQGPCDQRQDIMLKLWEPSPTRGGTKPNTWGNQRMTPVQLLLI